MQPETEMEYAGRPGNRGRGHGLRRGERHGRAGQLKRVALVGNPNSGKTTLFNALTGLHHKVGNYPGVTVERKEGSYRFDGHEFCMIDLPGTYSLNATSGDEQVVRDLLLGLRQFIPLDAILVVVDSSHLERQLFLATQVMQLGIPVVIALTMADEARRKRRVVNPQKLAAALRVPVVEVYAPRGRGIAGLKEAVLSQAQLQAQPLPWALPEEMLAALTEIGARIEMAQSVSDGCLKQLALQLLVDEGDAHPLLIQPRVREAVLQWRMQLGESTPDWRSLDSQLRFKFIHGVVTQALEHPETYRRSRSDLIDRFVTHPVAGMTFFLVVMALLFLAVFTLAPPFSDLLEGLCLSLAAAVTRLIPAGPLQGLIGDGVIGGVGAVIVFLPQIVFLFLFVALLEDSGYMARAAFLMNKHMRRAGLDGRAFIPLLSGFACAVPSIMAARTIADPRERLVTTLVVPFVSCSARLPVYTLMISAFIPPLRIFGPFTLQVAVLIGAYMFSLAAAVTIAWVMRKTVLRGETPPFIMELPPYRIPHWRTVLSVVWERARVFVLQAGTVILAMNIILWFLLTFPIDQQAAQQYAQQRAMAQATLPAGAELDAQLAQLERDEARDLLAYSIAGRIGHFIEPALQPLGFDWKIGVGLVASFAAREVIISTLAVIYSVSDDGSGGVALRDVLRNDRNPHTGQPVYNILVALNVMLFFILACQCMATLAVVKRETNSWRWPLAMFGYMTLLAYVACLVFYQSAIRLFPGAL